MDEGWIWAIFAALIAKIIFDWAKPRGNGHSRFNDTYFMSKIDDMVKGQVKTNVMLDNINKTLEDNGRKLDNVCKYKG